MSMPPPPRNNRNTMPLPTSDSTYKTTAPPAPKPPLGPDGHPLTPNASIPEMNTVNGKLSENETSLILNITLLPEHRDDPNVLRFISNYLRCRNTRQAAREAGLDARSGINLRNRPDIYAAIVKLTEKSVMKYGFDASEVIERVKEISALDPIEFERDDGSFKHRLSEIAPEARRAIKKFKAKNIFGKDPNGMDVIIGELIEVEFWDKMKAHELLGREKELFKETRKVEHDVTARMADVLLESGNRASERAREVAEGMAIDVTVKELPVGKGDES